MMRTGSAAALALCLALGFGLYQVKYAVQALDSDLRTIRGRIAADQERIHDLKVSWSYLTQPARLNDLAQRHLKLQPLTAAQLGSFDTLPLKEDAEPPQAAPDPNEVPIDAVLKAMQVAQRGAPPAKAEVEPAPASASAARGANEVPIEAVLKAMQVAQRGALPTERDPAVPIKAGGVE